MIKQLFLPFYLGLGGPVGRGDQYMPWIHIHDVASLLLFAIENDNVQGVLNGVAPQVCSIPTYIFKMEFAVFSMSFITHYKLLWLLWL